MSSYSSPVPRFSIGFLLLGLSVLSATADLAVWEFNDGAGRRLTQAKNSVGDIQFDGGITGVRTTGDGFLEIRRPLGTEIVRNAPLDAISSGKVWLDLTIAEWDLYGEPTEELSFGFSAAPGLEEAVAVLEWKRLTPSHVWVTGRAEGGDATDAAVNGFLPRKQAEPLRFVLECDLDTYTYEIYREGGSGQWRTIGRGAITEGATIHYVGFRVSHQFNNIDQEILEIDRLAITREDPIDRSQWEPLKRNPFVTAWSWAVADAGTGEIIAGEAVDTPRKSASITKAMTAYVVCELAKKDPAILDEMVQFSELALKARGSSAHIEEGESLPLREALFAFMLPSGNAVGNAIAEHFNGRLAPPEGAEKKDRHPRADFLAEMNRTAARLGMSQTIYRSAYGDGGTNDDRTSTARDLLRLAQAAMQNELFREVVGTKEYSTEVTQVDGTKRIGSWTNTNQFLGETGFNGIKTGTTRTARACLLISAEIDGRPLYSVVLGSKTPSRRYVDTRNLLEWAAEEK